MRTLASSLVEEVWRQHFVAYEDALATIGKAVALKPDEVTYTASRDHAEARIKGIRN